MAKGKKIIIPILIGAVGLYFIFRKKKPDMVDPYKDKTNLSEPELNKIITQQDKQVVVSEFPLKYGSKSDSVKQLQSALMILDKTTAKNFATGIFGTNTENILFKLKNKKTVDSKEELNAIISGSKLSNKTNLGSTYGSKYF